MIQVFLCFALTEFGCNNLPQNNGIEDTPTKGTITISCDESLKPIIEAEIMVFEQLYSFARINAVFCSEKEAIDLLLSDSVRMAIITRELNENETAVLKSQKISGARYHKIGYDAVAFILNPSNMDTSFKLAQVKQILSGQINHWNQISPLNKLGDIRIVFDNPSSGAIRMLRDSVLNGNQLGKNCFALKSNPEVIKYVEENKNAIGIIGVSWISDTDDSLVKYFLSNIKVAEIEPINLRLAGITNKPIQGNIALKQYPYWRQIKVASREMRVGLGTGFASFMESDPGQKIILKGGLVPFHSSIRTINLN